MVSAELHTRFWRWKIERDFKQYPNRRLCGVTLGPWTCQRGALHEGKHAESPSPSLAVSWSPTAARMTQVAR